MKGKISKPILLTISAAMILIAGSAMAESKDMVVEEIMAAYEGKVNVLPRIDNFIILLDQSGSMFMTEQGRKEAKAKIAKQTIQALNKRIPELGYNGSMRVFFPEETLLGPTGFSRNVFENTIEGLPETGVQHHLDDRRGVNDAGDRPPRQTVAEP